MALSGGFDGGSSLIDPGVSTPGELESDGGEGTGGTEPVDYF